MSEPYLNSDQFIEAIVTELKKYKTTLMEYEKAEIDEMFIRGFVSGVGWQSKWKLSHHMETIIQNTKGVPK